MSYDEIVDVADLDCIYLSYDEPKKDEFWYKIKNEICEWAVRVDGVKGSDAAHKAAAEASTTERFILIDGDNMPEPDFFNKQLDFRNSPSNAHKAQFRWKAVNNINGLRYGNGGMSSWTKDYVLNMKTHETSDGSDHTQVDFCMDGEKDGLYWHMYDCYSTTYPHATPFQAWRAGFREGVKMSLIRGRCPNVEEFKELVPGRNLNHLTIWHNVGSDVENGMWAIAGARIGTYMTMLSEWDHKNVMWFDNFPELFKEYENKDPSQLAEEYGDQLKTRLGLPICTFTPEQSKLFKKQYNADKYNQGIMVREIDVIRKIEGW